MAPVPGQFQYQKPGGAAAQNAPCRVSFDAQRFTLVPDSGAPLAFDLGDVETCTAGDYELTLALHTGARLQLTRFGKLFSNLSRDLTAAWRDRTVRCLLLEDLREVARFDATVVLSGGVRTCAGPAEVRLFGSNSAVLPTVGPPFQWRLAEVSAWRFDEAAYVVNLERGAERLAIGKLGRRTGEFARVLRETLDQLAARGAQALRDLFPFLTPEQLAGAARLLPEGGTAALAGLKALDARTENALAANVVDAGLKPYYEQLAARAVSDSARVGFKLLREEAEDSGREGEGAEVGDAPAPASAEDDSAAGGAAEEGDERAKDVIYWFFFPLRSGSGGYANAAAWEATSVGGRATYFFRLLPPEQAEVLKDPPRAVVAVEGALAELNRALVLLNFRREPVYLPGEALETQPRFRRYAIACRKLPELRRLRAAFLGRAIHTTVEAWGKQVEEILKSV